MARCYPAPLWRANGSRGVPESGAQGGAHRYDSGPGGWCARRAPDGDVVTFAVHGYRGVHESSSAGWARRLRRPPGRARPLIRAAAASRGGRSRGPTRIGRRVFTALSRGPGPRSARPPRPSAPRRARLAGRRNPPGPHGASHRGGPVRPRRLPGTRRPPEGQDLPRPHGGQVLLVGATREVLGRTTSTKGVSSGTWRPHRLKDFDRGPGDVPAVGHRGSPRISRHRGRSTSGHQPAAGPRPRRPRRRAARRRMVRLTKPAWSP